jgi:hypothetical protein
MILTESVVEDAALAMPMAALTRTFSRRERRGIRRAIRRPNPAIPEEASATDKEFLSVQNPSKRGENHE